MIYLRHSTCLDQTSCIITYAHELQHVVQEHRCPKLLRANAVLRANLWKFKGTPSEIDLPSEVEANIISKRVAETVCSVEVVRKFAREQFRLMNATNLAEQAISWKFFLDTPSSSSRRNVTRVIAERLSLRCALNTLGIIRATVSRQAQIGVAAVV